MMCHNYRALTLVIALAVTAGLQASVVSYDLSIEFTGATAPVGAAPWLTATFDDGGSPGSVSLTLTAVNLTASEFVSTWYFNLDPGLDPESLVFSSPSKTGSFDDPAIRVGADGYSAAGSGWYDVELRFATSGAKGGAKRFGPGDEAAFMITGIASLTANSFDFLSTPSGGSPPFPTAAHVQAIAGDDSGWTAVPEPATLGLLSIVSLVMLRRRRA